MEANSEYYKSEYMATEEEVKKDVKSQAPSLSSYNAVKEKLKAEFGSREPTREEIITYIKQLNLADDVLKNINEVKTPSNTSKAEINKSLPIQGDDLLSIKIAQGRSFKDYKSNSNEKMLICDLTFQDQRFTTKIIQASENPAFNQTFHFKLKQPIENYVNNYIPIHFVIIEEDKRTKKRYLVGVKRIDWRHVLHEKSIEQDAVFNNIDIQKKVPLGILTVRLLDEY
jgi:hypothetical protein